MIISQTPYRVSFAGGGTDLPAFYRREFGAVLSVTLNQHMYVTVSPRFEETIRVGYTRTEIADGIVRLRGLILSPDGSEWYDIAVSGAAENAKAIGAEAGAELLARAGPEFMASIV